MTRLSPPLRRLASSESAEHLRAKHRLARWLSAFAAEAHTPDFRVVVEYPFTEGGGGIIAWDQSGFERKPTRQTLRKRWGAVICICDLVLIEGEKVTTAIEVVKTNATPQWKLDWLHSHGVAVYEALAEAVLEGKERPQSFDSLLMPT
ncbi:MAG: hypothetical protein INF96_18750 [Roseomonas sp.]|jgi:hypothetical protein|nr:hypothetical protein [Roseomonas sp.]